MEMSEKISRSPHKASLKDIYYSVYLLSASDLFNTQPSLLLLCVWDAFISFKKPWCRWADSFLLEMLSFA